MTLETGNITVQHWQGDYGGDHGNGRDNDGEEGDFAHLAVLVGLFEF